MKLIFEHLVIIGETKDEKEMGFDMSERRLYEPKRRVDEIKSKVRVQNCKKE